MSHLVKEIVTILTLILVSVLPLQAQVFTPVNVFIPTFRSPKGKEEVGLKTATLFGLQIWRTYSRHTTARSSFDNAHILFSSNTRPSTYAEVEALARKQTKKPHVVLWGSASDYGNGIVVESNLLIRRREVKGGLGPEFWSVTIPTRKRSLTVSVDVPARQYEFAPIVLDPGLVSTLYEATLRRSGTEIYELKSTGAVVIGDLRRGSVEALGHDGDWSRVRIAANHRLGWVYLPGLSKNPSEVVDFCGGIVRILRKDWSGAVSLFQEVVNTSEAPTAIKVDSYLYMAAAYDRMDDPANSFAMVAKAYELNPYSKATTKYLYMSYLARLARVLPRIAEREEAERIIASAHDLLSKNKVLFADDDRWVKQVEQIIAELKG